MFCGRTDTPKHLHVHVRGVSSLFLSNLLFCLGILDGCAVLLKSPITQNVGFFIIIYFIYV